MLFRVSLPRRQLTYSNASSVSPPTNTQAFVGAMGAINTYASYVEATGKKTTSVTDATSVTALTAGAITTLHVKSRRQYRSRRTRDQGLRPTGRRPSNERPRKHSTKHAYGHSGQRAVQNAKRTQPSPTSENVKDAECKSAQGATPIL